MRTKNLLRLWVALTLVVVANGETVSGPVPAAPKTFTRTLYLVRHGAYDTRKKETQESVQSLTMLGLAQARLVADRLHGLPVAFSSFTASPVTRARQTAEIVHQSLPQLELQFEPLLAECTPPTWREDIMKGEKAESLAAAEQQLNAAFAKYFVPAEGGDRQDLMVCHANVIRYFVVKALGVDPRAWLGFSVPHCSITIIRVKADGTFRVFAVGDVGHIPPNLQSGIGQPDPDLVLP